MNDDAKDTPATRAKKPLAARHRISLAVPAILLLLAAVFFLPPALRREDPGLAFAALPGNALAASRHFDLSKTWKQQITTPIVAEILRLFGADAKKIAREEGTDWIIRITTGHSTTAAITVPQEGDEDFILYAASFAGAREPLLRLMMLLHWIPGVGRLRESENGTLYLALKDLDEDNEDLRIGFALQRHTLLASLAKSPEHVREIERRLLEASPSPSLFHGDAEPWKSSEDSPHTFWLHTLPGENAPSYLPSASATLRVRLEGETAGISADFAPGALPFLPRELMDAPALSGQTRKAASLAAGSAFALLLLPSRYAAPILSQALHLPISKREPSGDDAALYLNGQPYAGSAVHVAIPAATLLCPGIGVSRQAVERALPRVHQDLGVHFRLRKARTDGLLLDWLGEKGFVKLASKECVWIECPETGGAPDLLLCSAAQSIDAQRRGTPPERPAWQEAYHGLAPGNYSPKAFLFLDLEPVAYEARQLLSLARLAEDIGVFRLSDSEKSSLLAFSRYLMAFHHEGFLGLLLSTREDAARLSISLKLAEIDHP